MSAQYVSLGVLAEQLESYERLPVRLQEALQNSVWLTLKTNLICVPILLIAPVVLTAVSGFFSVVNPTREIAYTLLSVLWSLQTPLMILNVVSLVLVGLVMLFSKGLEAPVREEVHWAAWASAFPSGISAITTAIMGVLFGLLIIATLVIWILMIIVVCVAIALFFAGLGSS